jgi:hypothetical protein
VLTEVAGDEVATAEVVLKAPLALGAHHVAVVLPAVAENGLAHDESRIEVAFKVTAHSAYVQAWELPSAIPAGEQFSLKVGVRCSCGCALSRRAVKLFDKNGSCVADGRLEGQPFHGTSALYFCSLTATAPSAPGLYEWSVQSPAGRSSGGLPHADGAATVSLRVVEALAFEVTVEPFDSEKDMPIPGIHVLLHPYRTFTDERGIARLKVARGRYKLVVSGFKYVPYETLIDVSQNITQCAVLAEEKHGDGYFQP